jgi:ribonuclease G
VSERWVRIMFRKPSSTRTRARCGSPSLEDATSSSSSPSARRSAPVGDIYKGRVNKVLPGMDAAFIDIGLRRPPSSTPDMLPRRWASRVRSGDDAEPAPARVSIQELLQKGQDILVQVVKEPIGTKGAKVSGRISLPGRFLVLMPGLGRIGVSRKIADRAAA